MKNAKEITMNDGSKVLAFENGFCPLANHHYTPFEVRGIKYTSVHQYLESKKAHYFGDLSLRDQIIECKSAKDIAALSETLANFDPVEWSKFDKEHLWDGLTAKFQANKKLAEDLKKTGSIPIAYCNKYDKTMGTGCSISSEEVKDKKNWSSNLLGELLCQKRDKL